MRELKDHAKGLDNRVDQARVSRPFGIIVRLGSGGKESVCTDSIVHIAVRAVEEFNDSMRRESEEAKCADEIAASRCPP